MRDKRKIEKGSKASGVRKPVTVRYYVLSDSHSCSNDSGCGSGNFDEFTSCRKMFKRKILDNSEFCDSPQSGSVGRLKHHQSEKYRPVECYCLHSGFSTHAHWLVGKKHWLQ
ncbi:hypothetical protein DPMN_099799 [Dreissena polymorpha]|uniref:Uncharacterized protein n=1 Tax=Dreissena polymorpha TaxID=45954 RepID=A0A9D4LEQ1_DREPO|nr:hypothetical protein DPMN_099799 [Dreissena polymorpha]